VAICWCRCSVAPHPADVGLPARAVEIDLRLPGWLALQVDATTTVTFTWGFTRGSRRRCLLISLMRQTPCRATRKSAGGPRRKASGFKLKRGRSRVPDPQAHNLTAGLSSLRASRDFGDGLHFGFSVNLEKVSSGWAPVDAVMSFRSLACWAPMDKADYKAS
jgi:hypothetical protein